MVHKGPRSDTENGAQLQIINEDIQLGLEHGTLTCFDLTSVNLKEASRLEKMERKAEKKEEMDRKKDKKNQEKMNKMEWKMQEKELNKKEKEQKAKDKAEKKAMDKQMKKEKEERVNELKKESDRITKEFKEKIQRIKKGNGLYVRQSEVDNRSQSRRAEMWDITTQKMLTKGVCMTNRL
ncbi:hypothetical protein AMATHDRAFT_71056 [Amanita thiersii Skay4041]|uniref:Uncharacterized protein n=1 Tax=Amanita thiersii Skay4041 TaxID=703135 RepID=A0A2A9NDN2_9AGAR|nr:hypothetical protein AMATHDRAFT_71056 [Amanita thiersii Skay4041]